MGSKSTGTAGSPADTTHVEEDTSSLADEMHENDSYSKLCLTLSAVCSALLVTGIVFLFCCCCGANEDQAKGHEVIEYMTDSEGFMLHFCQWVAKNPSIKFAAHFENDDHCILAGGANSHRMEFKNLNSKFVFGGDATTRGDGSQRILRALVDFKARYPARVYLVLGNRDVMLMRLTSEWLDQRAHEAWVAEASKPPSEAFSTTNFELGTSKLLMPYHFHASFPKAEPVAAPWSATVAADATLKKLAHLHWLQAGQGSPASVRWGKKEQCVLQYADQRGNKPPTVETVLEVRKNCFDKCAGADDERVGSKPKRMAEILTTSQDKCGGATWQHVLAGFEELVKLPDPVFFKNLRFLKNTGSGSFTSSSGLAPSGRTVHEKLEFLRDNYEIFRDQLGDLAWYLAFANISLRFGPTFIVHADITGKNSPNPEPVEAPPSGAFACIPGLAKDDVYVDEDSQVLVAGAEENDVRKCADNKEDIGEWILGMEEWLDKQVYAWMVQPGFSVWPKVGVEGAVATEARPAMTKKLLANDKAVIKTPEAYQLMLAAKQVRDRGGAALLEYGACPSRESTEVPTVIFTYDSLPKRRNSYSPEIHDKLEKQNITTVVHGHKPWGIMPGAWYSENENYQKILVVNGDTSYSNDSPKTAPQPPTWLPGDLRGGAVSWIALQTNGSVDIRSDVAMGGFRNNAYSIDDVLEYRWETLDPKEPAAGALGRIFKALPGEKLTNTNAPKLQDLPPKTFKNAGPHNWHWKTAGKGTIVRRGGATAADEADEPQEFAVVQAVPDSGLNFYYELVSL